VFVRGRDQYLIPFQTLDAIAEIFAQLPTDEELFRDVPLGGIVYRMHERKSTPGAVIAHALRIRFFVCH